MRHNVYLFDCNPCFTYSELRAITLSYCYCEWRLARQCPVTSSLEPQSLKMFSSAGNPSTIPCYHQLILDWFISIIYIVCVVRSQDYLAYVALSFKNVWLICIAHEDEHGGSLISDTGSLCDANYLFCSGSSDPDLFEYECVSPVSRYLSLCCPLRQLNFAEETPIVGILLFIDRKQSEYASRSRLMLSGYESPLKRDTQLPYRRSS